MNNAINQGYKLIANAGLAANAYSGKPYFVDDEDSF